MKTSLLLLSALIPSLVMAGTSPECVTIEPADSSPWWLTITPYAWVTATDGDMGVAGGVAPVDISHEDTLHDLEFSLMLAVEAGIDRWAFGIDGIYGAFSSSTALPAAALPLDSATVDFDQFFARIHAGYQIIAREDATVTAFIGARYSYLSTDLDLNSLGVPVISASGSKSWVDPVIGLHGVWEISDRWFVHGGGDIGGFGVNSDLIWQANVALGYRFRENMSALIGYRGLGVDYSDSGFLVDTVAHGPAIGISIRF